MNYDHREKISWAVFCADCQALAEILSKQEGLPRRMLAITRGGLYPAALVARHLGIKEIETMGLESYEGQTQSGRVMLLKKADPRFLKDTLVIDDLVDTGKTFQYLREHTQNCVFATLYAKPNGKSSTDFSIRDYAQDTWIEFPWETEGGD